MKYNRSIKLEQGDRKAIFLDPQVNVEYAQSELQISSIAWSLDDLARDIKKDKPKALVISQGDIVDNYDSLFELKKKNNIKIIAVTEKDEKQIKSPLIDSYMVKDPIWGCSERSIKKAYSQIKPSTSESEDLCSKLQKIYPDVDPEFLYETANKIGYEVADLGEKINMTGSKVVIPIITKNGIDYFKASNEVIAKDVEWINIAQQLNYLTRIANASMKASMGSGNYSGIITRGTENEFNKQEDEDFRKYISTKERILISYAQQNKNVDLHKLFMDPVVASVFNTAINHVFIGPQIDQILAKSLNPRVKPFGELELRAKNTSDKYAFKTFISFKDKYDLALKKFNDQEDVGPKLIIHGDNGPRNLGREQPNKIGYFLGRKIDFGACRLGYVSEDLSKLETFNNGSFVPLYNHIVKELGGMAINESALIDKVNIETILNNMRSFSFVLSQNDFEKVKNYIKIIGEKDKLYKVA